MTESLPDFEAQTIAEGAPPARKPRRKPQKRRSTPQPTKTRRASALGKVDSRKPRGKIDKRTKAYRDEVKAVAARNEEIVRVGMRQASAPVRYHIKTPPVDITGRAGVVLSILALVANFAPEVRKQILAQAGALA